MPQIPQEQKLERDLHSPAEVQSGHGSGPGLVGSTLPGNLSVVGKVGEIPEGTLYRAEYPTGLKVAVVVLHAEKEGPNGPDSAIALLRLQRQLRQAIQIKHPNVAAVHEIGETSDRLVYVVMEQLAGQLLSTILAARGAVPLHEALDLCLQAAAGLQAAHNVGLVHGNLSPGTILITQGDGKALVKLIRFPPSSSPTEELPKPVTAGVSPEYASPERLSGHPPDQRSDVFSLGAVLHRLLTGKPPEGSRIGTVPKAMRTVLTHALAWDPAQRFQTITQFASALEGVAIVASNPKRTMANRSPIRTAAAISLAVLILAVLWLFSSSRRHPVMESRAVAATITRAPPPPKAERRSTPPKTDPSVVGVRDSALRGSSRLAAKRRSPPPASPAGTAIKQSFGSTARPTKGNERSVADASRGRGGKSVGADVRRGNDPPTRPKYLSPFRRSHPWAAVPGKRFYFRSTCRLALESTELLYFKSAEDARASGFVPSPVPGCS